LNEKMYEICETHGRMRCGECRYVEELEERLERYEKALQYIINRISLENRISFENEYVPIEILFEIKKIVDEALEK